MARKSRIVVPGYSLHVVQRGNNRQACFPSEEDCRSYLERLGSAAAHFGCQTHAYVLMANHVHLLLAPDGARAWSGLMQALGRRYVRHVNARHGRLSSTSGVT